MISYHAGAIPSGFATFFMSDGCPEDWQPVTDAQGRLIVSVASGASAGVMINTPLSDQEDRVHDHSWASTINLPTRSVSAIGCCDDESARSGSYVVSGTTTSATSGYPFVQLLLCSFNPSIDDTLDGIPFGTIAYFDPSLRKSCPPAWAPFTQGEGRFLVGSAAESDPVISPNDPLAVGQDPSLHTHFFSTQFDTADQSFSGVGGCCNSGPSAQSTVTVSGYTSKTSAGLPYVSMLTCVQQNDTYKSLLPRSALLFNLLKCPSGYILATNYSGRLFVALPDNSSQAIFGSQVLLDPSNLTPSHLHSFSGSFDAPSAGVGLVAGCCTGGYAHTQTYYFGGNTDQEILGVPLLLLPVCVKS